MTQLAELTNAQMIAVWNHYADTPIAGKFANAAIGRKRLAKLLAGIDAPECKSIAAVLNGAKAPAAEAPIAAKPAAKAHEDRVAAVVAKAKDRDAKAPKATPAVKAPAPAAAAEAPRYRGVWAEAAEAAARGKMPPAPDFTADTHKPYRAKLATLVALAKAKDAAGLDAVVINPTSSSPKALARYRDLCLTALRAKGA